MCGIFGYVGHKSRAASLVLSGLKSLEYRGYDSWGIAYKNQNKIAVIKHVGKIGQATLSPAPTSSISLGHTRWATHGGVTEINAHPHLDCTGTIAIVHNGIIANYEALKASCVTDGHAIVSDTDSEIAAHTIEELHKTLPFEEAVTRAFLLFEGTNAIVAMDEKSDTLIAVKNGSPLSIGVGEGELYISSDQHALSPFVKKMYVLKDGEMAILTKTSLVVKKIRDGRAVRVAFTSPPAITVHKQTKRFAHSMFAEIEDEPEVLSSIILHPDDAIGEFSKRIANAKQILLTGCGTAYHAALAGSYMIGNFYDKQATAITASELSGQNMHMDPSTFVIALSQSGETMDTLEAIKFAKTQGAKIGTLVNVSHSALTQKADCSLILGAGQERAVASTKAFIAKLAYLLLCFSYGTGAYKEMSGQLTQALGNLRVLQSLMSQQLLGAVVRRLTTVEHILVVGHGIYYPIALETALKIKEVSYIHAEGMASGELKHGPLALVTHGTPCIVLSAGTNDTHAQTAAMELSARGAFVIGIGPIDHKGFDIHIPVDDCGIATIIPVSVIGQRLAYELAIARGIDPDMPRNLAKSVTVQ